MTWTSHGHHIPGSIIDGPSPDRARCGGVGLCKVCSAEAGLFGTKNEVVPETDKWEVLEKDIRRSINKFCLENDFDIAHYALAKYVVSDLKKNGLKD